MASKLPPLKLPEVAKGPNYAGLDPLDARYFDPEVAKFLSEQASVSYRAYVEAALALTLSDYKICPASSTRAIVKATGQVKVAEVYRQEQSTKHDVKALVNVIRSRVPKAAKPYVHFSATSYDIISTAQVLQYRDFTTQLLLPRLKNLLSILINLCGRHADTLQIGRTHGQHALPITFGFALVEYVSRLGQSVFAIKDLAAELRGKFSGAVGAHNAISLFVKDPLQFEKALLAKLSLKPAEYSTQIAPPERLIRWLDELVIASGIMANLAHDLRHLQRSEIAEIREQFAPGQTGSSTMAHKRNPISFENVASLYKQALAQQVSANLNLVSEHQRDLTDSASARFYPVLAATVAEMAQRLAAALSKLEVEKHNLTRNLKLSSGAIAAEPLYLLLALHGHTKAHELAKSLAMIAQDGGHSLVKVVSNDSRSRPYWQKFTPSQRALLGHPETRYVGIAAAKTRRIVANWRRQLKSL